MTTEELLRPRWKVIADFPGRYRTGIEIGDILIPPEIDQPATYYVSDQYIDLTEFPHLFKKLEWWEEREVEDLPTYVKCRNSNKIFKVDTFTGHGEVIIDNTHYLLQHLPATEQEYLNQ